jgi:hypothetical protein
MASSASVTTTPTATTTFAGDAQRSSFCPPGIDIPSECSALSAVGLTSDQGCPYERTEMDLKNLFDKGKKMVDDRGGVDSLKEDAEELAEIAKGKGSLTDKAKEAASAVKEPGTTSPRARSATRTGRRLMTAGLMQIDRSRRSGAILEERRQVDHDR